MHVACRARFVLAHWCSASKHGSVTLAQYGVIQQHATVATSAALRSAAQRSVARCSQLPGSFSDADPAAAPPHPPPAAAMLPGAPVPAAAAQALAGLRVQRASGVQRPPDAGAWREGTGCLVAALGAAHLTRRCGRRRADRARLRARNDEAARQIEALTNAREKAARLEGQQWRSSGAPEWNTGYMPTDWPKSFVPAVSTAPQALQQVRWPEEWPYTARDFRREDESPDEEFYDLPRLAFHVDKGHPQPQTRPTAKLFTMSFSTFPCQEPGAEFPRVSLHLENSHP